MNNRTPNDPYNAIKACGVINELSDLLGKILTIIDASIIDEKQNKSVKDLIKERFSEKQNFISEISWYKIEEIENINSDIPLSNGLSDILVPYDYTKNYTIVSK